MNHYRHLADREELDPARGLLIALFTSILLAILAVALLVYFNIQFLDGEEVTAKIESETHASYVQTIRDSQEDCR